ncbi:MAG: hypothetical protein ACJ71N_03505 [Terriglobales bacterium]|jgi:hypothetical protein
MKRILVAIGIGVLVIIGLTIFSQQMRILVGGWAAQGKVLSSPQIICLELAAFWGQWKFLLSPLVLGACVGLAVLSSLIWPEKE